MRRVSQLCLLLVCALWMAGQSECVATLRTPSPAPLGSTVVLYCDIIGESNMPTNIFWGRANYDGTFSTTYIASSSLPSNYATGWTTPNNTYYLATLTITGVTAVDYATFNCMARSYKNLTQGYYGIDPLTLCKNGSYNQVTFAFLFATNVVLVALMLFVLRCLMQLTITNLIVAFACFLGALLFLVMMVIFWISPKFAAPNDDNSYIYWSPIVIVPASIAASLILWGALFFYIIKSFLANKKDKKNIISLIVFGCIALIQLVLLLVIICSHVYCTGMSSLPSSTDYSAASVTCSVLNFVAIVALCAYVFWMFKDNFKSIGILNSTQTKYSARDTKATKADAKKGEQTKVETITDRPDTGRSTTSAFNTDDEGEGKKGKKGKKAKDADASGAESAAEGGKKKKGKKSKDDGGASETEGAGKKKGKKGKKGGD